MFAGWGSSPLAQQPHWSALPVSWTTIKAQRFPDNVLSLTPIHSSPTEWVLPSASLPRRGQWSASWDYKTQEAGSRAHYQGPQLCQWGTPAPLQVSWEEKGKPRAGVWAPGESLTICIMPSTPWTWSESINFQTHLRAAIVVLRGLKERKWGNTWIFKKIFWA